MKPRPYVRKKLCQRMVIDLVNEMPDDEWRYVRAFILALEPMPLRQQNYIMVVYAEFFGEEIEDA